MTHVIYRKATPEDFDDIIRLKKALYNYEQQFSTEYSTAWPESNNGKLYLRDVLREKTGFCIVACDEHEIIGYSVVSIDREEYRTASIIVTGKQIGRAHV